MSFLAMQIKKCFGLLSSLINVWLVPNIKVLPLTVDGKLTISSISSMFKPNFLIDLANCSSVSPIETIISKGYTCNGTKKLIFLEERISKNTKIIKHIL